MNSWIRVDKPYYVYLLIKICGRYSSTGKLLINMNRVKGQSVELLEIRPMWRNPDKKIEEAVAKTTYVKSRKVWNVYWQRADL